MRIYESKMHSTNKSHSLNCTKIMLVSSFTKLLKKNFHLTCFSQTHNLTITLGKTKTSTSSQNDLQSVLEIHSRAFNKLSYPKKVK